MDSSSRDGYSHSYEFLAAKLEDINSRQKAYRSFGRQRLLIFEMRSEFSINSPDLCKTIGSERYDLGGLVVGCNATDISDVIKWRLDEYWMSEHGINKFCEEAAAFGNGQAAVCVPVIVRMEVVTVQRETETLERTKFRAAMPQKMSPLHVWHVQTVVRRELSYKLMDLLFNLPRTRPPPREEGEEGDLWCRICQLPTYLMDAFVIKIGCVCACSWAYHAHCVMRKLERSNYCRYCESQVYDAAYLTAPPLEEWWWEDEDLLSFGLRSY